MKEFNEHSYLEKLSEKKDREVSKSLFGERIIIEEYTFRDILNASKSIVDNAKSVPVLASEDTSGTFDKLLEKKEISPVRWVGFKTPDDRPVSFSERVYDGEQHDTDWNINLQCQATYGKEIAAKGEPYRTKNGYTASPPLAELHFTVRSQIEDSPNDELRMDVGILHDSSIAYEISLKKGDNPHTTEAFREKCKHYGIPSIGNDTTDSDENTFSYMTQKEAQKFSHLLNDVSWASYNAAEE